MASLKANPLQKLVSYLCHGRNSKRLEGNRAIEILQSIKKEEDVKTTEIIGFLSGLLDDGSSHLSIRVMAVVLLESIFFGGENWVIDWFDQPRDAQIHIQMSILKSLKDVNLQAQSKILSRIVSNLATKILYAGKDWPELLQFLLESVSTASMQHQEAALLVLSNLDEKGQLLIINLLLPHRHTLWPLLSMRLLSKSVKIKSAACRAVINLAHFLFYFDVQPQFSELLKALKNSLISILDNHEIDGQESLIEFTRLALKEPQILRPHIRFVFEFMLQILCNNVWNYETTKRYAAEMLTVLAEGESEAPQMMRRFSRHDLTQLFSALMRIVLEGSREAARWIFRLSKALGGEIILPIALEVLQDLCFGLPSEKRDDKTHFAGIYVLQMVAKGSPTVLSEQSDKYLKEAVEMVFQALAQPNPRVQWAALTAIAQFSVDISPSIQLHHHHTILPALLGTIKKNQDPRVKENADKALLFFCKSCPLEILKIYSEEILLQLPIFLQNKEKPVEHKQITIFVLNILAHGNPEAADRYCTSCLGYLLRACSHDMEGFRQEAASGIRICAEFASSVFKDVAEDTVNCLRILCKGYLLENKRVTIFGQVVYNLDKSVAAQVFPAWLSLLPMKNDLTKAKNMHEELCSVVEKSLEAHLCCHEIVCEIISVFTQVLTNGNDLATEDTVRRMKNLMKNIKLRYTRWNEIFSSLNEQRSLEDLINC